VSETTPARWLPVPGFARYLVSDTGIVLSKRGKPMATAPTKKRGYLRLSLLQDGERRTWGVHQVVMLAFVGPCPAGMEIRHLDGNPANNALTNLVYGTSSENTQDALRHGRHNMARKTHCKHGHEFTPENTYMTPRGERQCRACVRRRVSAYAGAKRRAAKQVA
jgi:hypothetical protein